MLELVEDRVLPGVMEGVEVELQGAPRMPLRIAVNPCMQHASSHRPCPCSGFRAASNVSTQDVLDTLVQSMVKA